MKVSLKSLLVTGLLAVSTQAAQAEWQPVIPSNVLDNVAGNMPVNPFELDNNAPQVPWTSPSIMPITWGDCIPVPVNAGPNMPSLGINAPTMGVPYPIPPAMAPAPMNLPAPAFPVAPPSPYFGNVPVIPMPMPLPEAPKLNATGNNCIQTNDDSKQKLTALQTRYDKASEASKIKIEELKQILNDTQNQLQDSVASVGALTKSKESGDANINEIKKKMEALTKTSEEMLSLKEKENAALKKHLATLDNAGSGIQQQLMTLRKEKEELQNKFTIVSGNLSKQGSADKTNIDNLKQKIAALTKTSGEMLSLKEKENASLKKHLAEMTNAGNGIQQQLTALAKEKDELQKRLALATEKSGQQAQKLMAFGQSADSMNALKKQLASMTKTNEDMQLQLQSLLKQSSAKLTTIQNAHGLQGKENEELKKQLEALTAANKNMQLQIGALKTDSADKNKQLLTLKQSSSELDLLKQTNQAQSAENATLKKQLEALNATYKNMQLQIGALKTDSADKNKQLLTLKQSSSELGSLKQTNQAQATENATLKKQLEELNIFYKQKLTAEGNAEANLKSELSRLQQANQAQQGKYNSLKKQFDKLNGDYKSQVASYQNAEAEQKTCNANYGELSKKLSAFGNTEATLKSEISRLKQAQNTQLGKNDTLVKQLADFKNAYNALQAQNATLKADAAGQNKTILGLKESSNKLGLLQQAVKTQEANAVNLKSQLALCGNAKTELETCKTSVDQNSQKLVASLDNAARLEAELSKLKVDFSKATADTDNDGVLDSTDKCPTSPVGSVVDATGCPKVVEVAKVVEEVKVAPVPAAAPVSTDADNDGVVDDSDLCPASEAGATVNQFGCKETENITLEGVTFELGSAKLKNTSLAILDVAAKSLTSNPGLKIQIEGHTDNQGGTAVNQRLSQIRANAVMIYLIRQGVKAETLSAKGFGASQPVTTNDTNEGRAKNRRVDLKILK